MNLKQVGLGFVLAMFCFCMWAPAEMPRQFYYEDFYATSNGPCSGYVGLQLQLYNAASNGTCLYEDSNAVEVVDGFYATLIGDNTVSGSLSNALDGGEIYVQAIIDGTPQVPREPLVPVPYALNAAGVASNTITAAMISSAAVQSAHLASGSVTASKLAGDVDEQYIDASGDTMTGSLDMGGHSISNAQFIGDGAGLTNLPMTGLTTNAADDRYVNVAGDTLQGDLCLLASLRGYGGNFADTNLVVNPTLDTTGAPWTDGSGWCYWHQGRIQVACNSSGGIFDRISQSVSGLVSGALYRVSYDIVENNWVSPLEPGTVRIYFGHQLDSVSNTAVGTHTSYFTATTDTIDLAFWSLLWRQGATMDIDNISLTPATMNDKILYVNPTTGLRELNVQSIAGPVSISNNLEVSGSVSIDGELSASSFTGEGAGLSNISAAAVEDGSGSGLDADLLDGLDSADFAPNPHEHDDEYVNASGDTMTGDFSLAGSLLLLPTQESVLSPGFQTDGAVTIHWMTEAGTYFKFGEIAGGGDRFHFGSDGTFQAWGDIYSRGGMDVDGGLSVGGGANVSGDLSVGDHITANAANGRVEAASVKVGSVMLGGASNALVVPNLADSVSGAVRIGIDEGVLYGDWELEGRGSVKYDPVIGTNQYALWVRNFGSTPDDARGLLVTTPDYNGAEGIIFHAASLAGGSMASRFIVGADGNVGVGVNDPQNKLHVAGDARVSGNVLMMDGQSLISPNFNSVTWGSAFDKWGPNAYLKYGFVRELLVAQNAEFQGKVKIGTSFDYAQLNVAAPTNLATPTYAARFESRLGADSDKARGLLVNFPDTTNANSILFHAMSGPGPYTNSRVIIKADGKVGIGTSYPEATLHVHGDARFDQVVWIQPAGDLSMGAYTNGAPQ